jgi:DNA invertase Pin-like site-specific DNA recombinase
LLAYTENHQQILHLAGLTSLTFLRRFESTMKRIGIYLRVSTSKQETSNQRRELEAVAKRSGWEIVKVYEDAGISGARGQRGSPRARRYAQGCELQGIRHGGYVVGRSARPVAYRPAVDPAKPTGQGHRSFPDQQGLDTSTTAGKAKMLGVFAEFERGIIRERVNAGLARAKAKGVTLGRPRIDPQVEKRIKLLRAKGYGILKIAGELGIGTSAVQRVVAGS